jgi:hypothetical protein
MTLHDTLNDLEEKADKTTPIYRVHYPPRDYYGDEWDLLDKHYIDFVARSEAEEFAVKSVNHRAPPWAQPNIQVIAPDDISLSPDTVLALITALREATEMAKSYMLLSRYHWGDGSVTREDVMRVLPTARNWLAKYAKGEKG